MAMSEAKKKANKKWNEEKGKAKYDRIQLVVQKGKKEKIQAVASANGESVNAMINRLLDSEIEKYNRIARCTSQPGGNGISGSD